MTKKKKVTLSLKRRTLRRLDSATVEKVQGGQWTTDDDQGTTGTADSVSVNPYTSKRTLPTQQA